MKKSIIAWIAAYILGIGIPTAYGVKEYKEQQKLWENGGPKIEHVLLRTTPKEDGISVYKIKKSWYDHDILTAKKLCDLLKSDDFYTFKAGLNRVDLVGRVDKDKAEFRGLTNGDKPYVEAFREKKNKLYLERLVVHDNTNSLICNANGYWR